MNIAVFISDNRGLDSNKETCQYNSCTAYINAVYCVAHKYDFFYMRPHLGDKPDENDVYVCRDTHTGEKRHASWAKLMATSLILRNKPKVYDYVVCVDSDCVFKNIQTRVESIIEKFGAKDIIMANNAPYHSHLPCCGFFICKNTEWTRGFLETWYDYKNPSSDSDEWKHIMTLSRLEVPIPDFPIGKYWEQDTMWLLYQDPDIKSHIQLLDEGIMYDESKDQYLIHVTHDRHDLRKRFFLEFVEHLEKETKQSFETILSYIPIICFTTSI
jgi:hypothetical protein